MSVSLAPHAHSVYASALAFEKVVSGAGETALFEKLATVLVDGGGGGSVGPPRRIPPATAHHPSQFSKKWCLAYTKRLVSGTRSFFLFRLAPKRASGAGEALASEKSSVWRRRDSTFAKLGRARLGQARPSQAWPGLARRPSSSHRRRLFRKWCSACTRQHLSQERTPRLHQTPLQVLRNVSFDTVCLQPCIWCGRDATF